MYMIIQCATTDCGDHKCHIPDCKPTTAQQQLRVYKAELGVN